MPTPDTYGHYAILTAMLAPAFFLTATASLLMSANARLARVIDRARVLLRELAPFKPLFVEEPVLPEQAEYYPQLAAMTHMLAGPQVVPPIGMPGRQPAQIRLIRCSTSAGIVMPCRCESTS